MDIARHLTVLLPSSEDEAVAAFGDGTGVTVVAGGTIVLPELTAGRLRPAKALMLTRAGLSGCPARAATARSGRQRRFGPRRAAGSDRAVRGQRRRRRDPRPGDGRRKPLRRGRRCAARRPPGARSWRSTRRSARRARAAAARLRRGVSRRPGRPPRARRQLRAAGCGSVRAARPSTHARLLGARRVGGTRRRRNRPRRRRRSGGPGRPAPLRRGECGRSGGGGARPPPM